MKRILITGAAGFIGSHLADRLLERGDAVIALDNFNDYYDPAVKRGNIASALEYESVKVEKGERAERREDANREIGVPGKGKGRYTLYEADICDEARVQQIFREVRPDVVVHLAARAGVRPSLKDPNLYHRVNVIGSQHILDACREFNPSHLVFASSSSVYGGCTEVPFREDNPVARPISPYAATKRMNELQAHVYSHIYGLNVTMLRFFTVYGPRQRPDMAIHKFTQLMLEDRPVPMFGDGSTRRDYTYIDDIIDGLVRCVDRPFRYEIFNLGEHHTTSLRELIDLIAQCVGKPAKIEVQPLQPGDVTITYADIDHARELLGYNPTFSMQEGIRRFVEWYRKQHKL